MTFVAQMPWLIELMLCLYGSAQDYGGYQSEDVSCSEAFMPNSESALEEPGPHQETDHLVEEPAAAGAGDLPSTCEDVVVEPRARMVKDLHRADRRLIEAAEQLADDIKTRRAMRMIAAAERLAEDIKTARKRKQAVEEPAEPDKRGASSSSMSAQGGLLTSESRHVGGKSSSGQCNLEVRVKTDTKFSDIKMSGGVSSCSTSDKHVDLCDRRVAGAEGVTSPGATHTASLHCKPVSLEHGRCPEGLHLLTVGFYAEASAYHHIPQLAFSGLSFFPLPQDWLV